MHGKQVNPLNQADIALAKDALASTQAIDAYLGKCRNCGIDVADAKARNDAHAKFFTGVLSQFTTDVTDK
jgi:hypothetical protein